MRKLLTILFFLFSLASSAQLTVNAGADSVLTISPAGRYNQTNTDTGYLRSIVSGATGSVSYSWLQLSGPNTATLQNPEGDYSSVTNLIVGIYNFRLTVSDANGSAFDDVKLTVQPCGTGAITLHLSPASDRGAFLNMAGIQPGSVFYIDSANCNFSYIYGYNIKGAPGCPIKFENYGFASLQNGFDIERSQWVEISGSGPVGSTNRRSPRTNIPIGLQVKAHFKEVYPTDSTGFYQIYNQKGGAPAIHIHGASTNVYIHNIEAYKTKYGIQDKDDDFDGNCDSTLNYPNGVENNHVIVYNWLHYTESQAMYIGNTSPNNAYTHIRQKACFNTTVWGEPGRQGDFTIMYNECDSNGRSNIQVSLNEVGMTRISHNTLTYGGCQRDETQGCNIFLGGYTHAMIDSNYCSHTFTFNMADFGAVSYIYDNVFEYGGYSAATQRWIPGHYDNTTGNWVLDISPDGRTDGFYTGAMPDTATVLAYGTSFQKRADATIPVDSSRVWFARNICSNARIMDIVDANRYVFTLYSNNPSSAIPSWPGGGYVWAKDSRTYQNTYNGALISGAPYISASPYTPAIDLHETPIPYIPIVSAGRDYRITESFWELVGNVFPMGGHAITTTTWAEVSGPSVAVISDPHALHSWIGGLVNGTYKFSLTATDNSGVSQTDYVSFEVSAVSSSPPPSVNAGPNQTVNGTSATLNGFATPAPGESITSYSWARLSGPNSPTITAPTSATTNVIGLIPGTYVFTLTAMQTDAQIGSASTQVIVNVLAYRKILTGGTRRTIFSPAGRAKRRLF